MASKEGNEEKPIDMKSIVREKVLSSIHASTQSGSGWLVAVLDKHATRVISSCVSMFDIMEQRITLVESLEKKRQPFPEMDVIYFIAPCEESIKLLSDDFKKKPCYANAHLFFLSKVSDEIMGQVQKSPSLVARIKTFKEMNLDFYVSDAYLFHLDENIEQCYRDLYSDALAPFAKHIAQKLATVCFSLNECPVIRCRKDSAMEAIAMLLVSNLNEMKTNREWWYHGSPGHTERPQGTLLLLDRTEDLVTPALHWCDYESLVVDFIPCKDNVITIKKDNKDTLVVLNEKDELWSKFKRQHVADVLTGLGEYIKDIKARNPKFANIKGDDNSVADVSSMIKEMPEYQAQLGLGARHHTIAQQCLAVIQARDKTLLNMINDIEQTLATGFTQESMPMKLKSVLEEMMDYLMSNDVDLKLRLLIILVASQRDKLSDLDFDRVCMAAGFGAAEKALLRTVQSLCQSVNPTPTTTQTAAAASSGGSTKKGWFPSTMFGSGSTGGAGSSGSGGAAAAPEFKYPSSRFQPPLKAIASELANGTLSKEAFPSPPGQVELTTTTKPTAQSNRKNQGWSKKAPFVGGRNIIFMAGGITRAEIHAVDEVSDATNKEMVVGGTSLLDPKSFLQGIRAVPQSAP